jgi:invasion protein IalB
MTKFSTSKALFAITGAALIVLLVVFGRSQYVEASVKEGEKFDDWIVACEKDTNKKQLCFLSQVLSSKEDTKHKVAEFRIGYFGGKDLKMIQILPFGVNLQAGTSIISGKELLAPGKFTTCQSFGCIAVADLSKGDIENILLNAENSVGIISSDAKQTNILMSNKGLKEGLEALK